MVCAYAFHTHHPTCLEHGGGAGGACPTPLPCTIAGHAGAANTPTRLPRHKKNACLPHAFTRLYCARQKKWDSRGDERRARGDRRVSSAACPPPQRVERRWTFSNSHTTHTLPRCLPATPALILPILATYSSYPPLPSQNNTLTSHPPPCHTGPHYGAGPRDMVATGVRRALRARRNKRASTSAHHASPRVAERTAGTIVGRVTATRVLLVTTPGELIFWRSRRGAQRRLPPLPFTRKTWARQFPFPNVFAVALHRGRQQAIQTARDDGC